MLLLPDLCQRFAQNERTLFSYLGSREPHGFRDALASLRRAGDWLHPATVYDYFVRNQPAVLSDPLTHRRWAEVVTAVERAGHVDAEEDAAHSIRAPSSLAKTIGLLNLVSRTGGLKASEDVLRLLYPSRPAFQTSVARLHDASVVQYRRFSGEYRVWQGTDFDIDERTAAEAQKLGRFDLAKTLTERTGGAPVVARRHSAETGTLRYFEVVFADPESRRFVETNPKNAPRIVFVLAEGRSHHGAFHAMLAQHGSTDVWALHPDGTALRAALADVLALEGVQRAAQELASDPVAAREIRERLEAARAAEREAVGRLLGEPGRSEWFLDSRRLDVNDRRELQRELSALMDRVYAQGPRVRNELVNRNRLSSQAAAARNKLFRHMLEGESLPELGIQKYPPERAVYRSILGAGRLHVEKPEGWAFVPPGGCDPLNLVPAWERLDVLMAATEDAPVAFSVLADALAEPPVGMRRGIFPIVFLHYYLLHRYEIAFYDEGVYTPALTVGHLERMMRRPDQFAFQRFRIEGVRADLFAEYGRALFDREPDAADPLPLAKALLQFADALDDYTRTTRALSPSTLRVREALYFAKSPQALLFDALPRACGYDPDGTLTGFAEKLRDNLRELKNTQSVLADGMRRAFADAFRLHPDVELSDLREELRVRSRGLDRYTIDTEGLRSFVRRLAERETEDHGRWFSGVLLFLGRKPPVKWTDQDRATAEYRLAQFAARLLDLEKLRLHFDAAAIPAGKYEAVLVKVASETGGEAEEIVLIDADKERAVKTTLGRLRRMLDDIDDAELQLAIVARLAERFLADYHDAQLSQPRSSDRERRHA